MAKDRLQFGLLAVLSFKVTFSLGEKKILESLHLFLASLPSPILTASGGKIQDFFN